MREIFLLSVQDTFARMLVSGLKHWEFRENPDFGRDGERSLALGDAVFLVSVGPHTQIVGYGWVEHLLRGPELGAYFKDVAQGRWLSSGAPSVQAFQEEILGRYQAAVRLAATPLAEPIAVDRVRQRFTGRPWSGLGLVHAASLKRYALDGQEVEEALRALLPAPEQA